MLLDIQRVNVDAASFVVPNKVLSLRNQIIIIHLVRSSVNPECDLKVIIIKPVTVVKIRLSLARIRFDALSEEVLGQVVGP